MITIFVLLGLIFLGGGVAGIVDGLPYMVLERGFTQVIVGTIFAMAGVLMLALTRILVEVRRIKTTVGNAVMALSVAGAAPVMAHQLPPDPILPPEPILPAERNSPPEPDLPPEDAASRRQIPPPALGLSPGLSTLGVGAAAALAGAGGALVATRSSGGDMADRDDEPMTGQRDSVEPDVPEAPIAASAEPDRIVSSPDASSYEPPAGRDVVDHEPTSGAHVAAAETDDLDERLAAARADEILPVEAERPAESWDDADGWDRDEARRETEVDAPTVDERDPFAVAMLAAVAARIEPRPDAASRPADRDDEAAAASRSPDPIDETSRDEAPRTEPRLVWPEPGTDDAAPEQAAVEDAAPESRPGDEFGFLRDRLAGRHAAEEPPVPEDAPMRAAGTIEAAGAWMDPKAARREPWFDDAAAAPAETPRAADADEAAPALQPPAWPPSTRETSALETDAAGSWPELDERDGPDTRRHHLDAPRDALHEVRHEPVLADPAGPLHDGDVPEPVAPEEPAPPAASEEGIVGAYQVGDAHFTIFADGSIKARTPDGDYNFGSMDELKTYLASEKTRLGV